MTAITVGPMVTMHTIHTGMGKLRATEPMAAKEEDCQDRAMIMSPWGPTHNDELPMATT